MAITTSQHQLVFQPLEDIAQFFLHEWQQTHDHSSRQACAALTHDRLIVTIHDALTESERQMTTSAPGRVMVRRYINEIVNNLYPRLASYVESRLDCFVAASDVDVTADGSSIEFCIELRDVSRMPTMIEPLTACVGQSVSLTKVA